MTPADWVTIWLSLKVALTATVVSLPFGILVALVLARGRFPGHGALNILVHLPLVLPPVVTGYLLLLAFGAQGPIGRVLEPLGLGIAFRWTGAALAAAVMAFPLMVRAIRLAIEAVPEGLPEAAKTLGASPLRVVLTVILPLALPGILAGAILALAKALGEFGATITFVSNIPGQTQTIPTAIYAALQIPGQEPAAARLILVSIAISAAALIASEWLATRARRRR
ncbi:molybdate ABC transporter permease subunit [Rhodobacterales bacterium HKCCE3408]|nr:molybdate ABC transporter permease subunit [Rhodobacterales bacterium HKCCE3408]